MICTATNDYSERDDNIRTTFRTFDGSTNSNRNFEGSWNAEYLD
jgi:hypothetical protein